MSSMDSNVKAVTITGTGVAYANRAHLRGFYYLAGGTAATLVLKDSTGSTTLSMSIPANGSAYVLLPGRGILHETNINCTTFTNLTSVTLFYEG